MAMQQIIMWPWSEERLRRLRDGGPTAALSAVFSVQGKFEPLGLETPLPIPGQEIVLGMLGRITPVAGVSAVKFKAGREQMALEESDVYLGSWIAGVPSAVISADGNRVDLVRVFFYAQKVIFTDGGANNG